MAFALKPLNEQVIVVTGASSGIGLVTARTAAKAGARVMLVARSGDELAGIVRDLNNEGCQTDYAIADVGIADQVFAVAAKAVGRFGRIDTWVNDAGVAIYAKLLDTPDDEHERMMRTNYFGVVHGGKAAMPHLKASGGAFITVGSIASDIPAPLMSAYAATKHAVKAYVESLRIELKGEGEPVSITLVKPAGIDTPIAHHASVHGDGAAMLPPPTYDPQLVADAILDSAVNARREIIVGGIGRAQVLFAQHFPALFEWLAPASQKAMLDPTRRQPTPSNLFEGERAGDERSGDQPGLKSSAYTTLAEHPKATAAGFAALVGLGVAVFVSRRERQ